MAHYDEQFLLIAAQRFLDRARWIVLTVTLRYTIGTFLICWIGGFVGERLYPDQITFPPITPATLGGIFGLLFGVAIGTMRAFDLRVEAQKLLALIEIERRTKKTAAEVSV